MPEIHRFSEKFTVDKFSPLCKLYHVGHVRIMIMRIHMAKLVGAKVLAGDTGLRRCARSRSTRLSEQLHSARALGHGAVAAQRRSAADLRHEHARSPGDARPDLDRRCAVRHGTGMAKIVRSVVRTA